MQSRIIGKWAMLGAWGEWREGWKEGGSKEGREGDGRDICMPHATSGLSPSL